MRSTRAIVGAIVAIATASSTVAAQPAPQPATPPPAPAPGGPVAPSPDQARAHAQELAAGAKGHFDHGEYAQAIADYREAYRLWPSPGLLYNLGQAYRLAGDCAHAADSYREYLRLSPDSPYRMTVEQNLSAAEACAKAAEPKPEPKPASPPVAVSAPVPAPAVKTTVAPEDTGRTRRLTGLALAGGGVVLLAAGGYFARDASSAQQQVADFYAKGGDWADIASVDARGHRDRTLSIVGFATGGLALAAGVTLYVLGRNAERSVAIVPAAGGGGQVVVGWRF